MTGRFVRSLLALPLALAMLAGGGSAIAQEPPATGTPARPTVELSAEANRPAPNDLATATAYVESSDANPARLAERVNETMAAALAEARRYPSVKARTTGLHTWPVYGKEGRRIEGWRTRSEIQLESRDLEALSELLGKLQATLAVGQLTLQPAPETRKSVADLAATDAIRAFEARAKTIAGTLDKRYRIRHLAVAYGGTSGPIRPMMRASAVAEAAAPPMEAGESEVSVTVHGTIELID